MPAASEPAALGNEQLEVYFALKEVSSLLRYAVEQQLVRDGGLSGVQFEILAGLNDLTDGRERLTDIADRIVYSRSGLTYQAGRLEKARLIARSPDPADERSSMIAITAKGRELVRRVLPGHIQVVRATLLEHLSRDETVLLTAVLRTVRDGMRSAPPRSAKPRSTPRGEPR